MMDKFIEGLIEKGMGQLMDQSRDELAAADHSYQKNSLREEEAERRVLGLGLTKEQQTAIDDYLDCVRAGNHIFADLSYLAGIKDTVGLLASIGAIKIADAEE